MDLMFSDPSFAFEALRTIGYAPYGGADVGEMTSTAERIPDGDEAAWYTQWRALADRVSASAVASGAAGHVVSAREAHFRASSYYRMAEFYLRDDPDNDPRVKELGTCAVESFARAAALLPAPLMRVQIPYEGATLPGWWVPADPGSSDPRGAQPHSARRPVLLFHGGYDSTGEELYFAGGAAAARRGYDVLLFEGPGQGSVLRDQHLRFRPDWEVVVTSAVDWLIAREGVDPLAIALMGMSMGGLLAPRAASAEHRLAAVIAYDGLYSMTAMKSQLPPSVPGLLAQRSAAADDEAERALRAAMASSVGTRWAMQNGMWAFGAQTPVDLMRAFESYDLAGVLGSVRCPTLVLEGEVDHFTAGQHQAQRMMAELTVPVTHHVFRQADGAGQHCQEGAMSALHQVVFDWLDDTLKTAPSPSA